MVTGHAGVGPVQHRPDGELADLLHWLSTGEQATSRLDFAAGTAMPDGRLDLCKQALGPGGAAAVTAALRPGVVKHLLLGTDGLGNTGAAAVASRTGDARIETLYLGCNGITPAGACTLTDRLRASPQMLTGLWLKRNPIGREGAIAAVDYTADTPRMRTLDLTQTGLDGETARRIAETLLYAAEGGRRLQRLYLGGNQLFHGGADAVAGLIAAGAVHELYAPAAWLGNAGAHAIADALRTVPYGRLRRLSLASNDFGPELAAEICVQAIAAGVEVLDLGRVKSAGALGAANNRVDESAADRIGQALAAEPHRMHHLILADTGLGSRGALRLLARTEHATTSTRFLLGKGIAASVKKRLNALSGSLPDLPELPPDVAAIRSVHRTARTPR